MNVQRLLLFCFLSALWDGHAGIVILQKYSGDQMRFVWHFASNASIRFFCRRECQESDVLFRTEQNRAVSGRFSIEYQKTPPTGGYVTGIISPLETSDSGRYRIGVGGSLGPDEFGDFEIRVTDEKDGNPHHRMNIHTGEEGGNVSVVCRFPSSRSTKFFCRNNCKKEQILLRTTGDEAQSGRYSIRFSQEPKLRTVAVKTTISQLSLTDSGLYSCGLGESLASAAFTKFNILVTAATAAPTPDSPETQSSGFGGFPVFCPPPITYSHFSVLLVVGGSVLIGGLSAVVVLLLSKLKEKNQKIRSLESATYDTARENPTYQSLKPDAKDQEQVYSTLRTPEDTQKSC